MPGKKHMLFYLNDERRDRISCDDLQWMHERGNPASARHGKDSGYRGLSFVCTRKEILYRVLQEDCVPLSVEACALLAALPDEFTDCRALLDRLGVDGLQAWLRRHSGARRGRRDTLTRRARRDHSTSLSDSRRRSLEALRGLGRWAS